MGSQSDVKQPKYSEKYLRLAREQCPTGEDAANLLACAAKVLLERNDIPEKLCDILVLKIVIEARDVMAMCQANIMKSAAEEN